MYHDLPTETERRELRRFGLTMAILVPALFGLLLPWVFGREYRLWPWLVAVVFAASALLMPVGLRTSRRIWMVLGSVLGWLNSRILLGAVFWVLVVPTGLVMRLTGGDFLARRFDAGAASYRVASRARRRDDMERPF